MPSPSGHKGMGSILHGDGCTFRTWAPHADAVDVIDPSAKSQPLRAGVAMARDAEQGPGRDYWSTFVRHVKADDEYRFRIRRGGHTFTRMDPYGRDATSSGGNSLVVDSHFEWGDAEASYRTPPWHELVVYELHVGTFNRLPNGDPGTFQSLIDKLGHLEELGVNAVELMPAYEFDFEQSMGYNPSLPFAIESAYGTPHMLKQFVRAAHQRGIAVIFDVVYNHWGSMEGGLGECLWQFDGWHENGNGGIYFYNDDRRHTPWGQRPDFGRPEVRQYIRDNAMSFLHEYRGDGLRWDSTKCCHRNRGFCKDECCGEGIGDGWDLMKWVNDEAHWQQPWKIMVAEDVSGNPAIVTETKYGGAGFDAQWEPLHGVRAAVLAQFDGQRDLGAVAADLLHRYGTDAFRRMSYVEGHDEAKHGRLPERIWPGDAAGWFARKRSTLAAGVLFTAPSIPMMFQGQELLEWGEWSDGPDDGMDWSKRQRFDGIFRLYRDLIRLRRNWFNNTRGLRGQHLNVFHVNDGDKLIAYHRWADGGGGDDVVVVANFADRSYGDYNIGFPRWGAWHCRFNSDAATYGDGFGNFGGHDTFAADGGNQGMPYNGNVRIGPYSVLIFSQ